MVQVQAVHVFQMISDDDRLAGLASRHQVGCDNAAGVRVSSRHQVGPIYDFWFILFFRLHGAGWRR